MSVALESHSLLLPQGIGVTDAGEHPPFRWMLGIQIQNLTRACTLSTKSSPHFPGPLLFSIEFEPWFWGGQALGIKMCRENTAEK